MYFSYRLGETRVRALNEVSLDVHAGRLTCLAGPSGSGKSTLLALLGLIEPVQQGTLLFAGEDLALADEKRKNEIRRDDLGFVFQQFLLFDTLTAFENIEYFLKNRPLSRRARQDKVEQALAEVGLFDHSRKRPPEMSGGQRQRVAIARALVKEPKVIIADEPTASLDQATGREIMTLFRKLVARGEKAVVLASHDAMAMSFATDLVRLKDGRIQAIEHALTRQKAKETEAHDAGL